jgi:hypothetical protein
MDFNLLNHVLNKSKEMHPKIINVNRVFTFSSYWIKVKWQV